MVRPAPALIVPIPTAVSAAPPPCAHDAVMRGAGDVAQAEAAKSAHAETIVREPLRK